MNPSSQESFSYDLPIPVQRALRKLGKDIRDARKRRRITTSLLSERASISRTTLANLERGHPGVSIRTLATVLFVLGMIDRISDLADALKDPVGLALDEERLPQRVRHSSKMGATRSNR